MSNLQNGSQQPATNGEGRINVVAALRPAELIHVIKYLNGNDVQAATMVNKSWCFVGEQVFRQKCDLAGWRLPRRPRGDFKAEVERTGLKWRTLYMQHACHNCYGRGEFPIRGSTRNDHKHFLLCRKCVFKEEIRAKLETRGLRIDLKGVTGKALFHKQSKKKRRRDGT